MTPTPAHRRRLPDTLARRLGVEHNALRRGSDRVETTIVVTLLSLFLIGAPLLGLAVGLSAYEAGLRTEHAQAAPHQVTAQLTADAPAHIRFDDQIPADGAMAAARWTYAGDTHTGQVRVQPGAKAGSTMKIPVDNNGRPVYRPWTHTETITRGIVLSSVSALTLGFALWATHLVVRSILINRRLDDWETDWSAFEPRWTDPPGT